MRIHRKSVHRGQLQIAETLVSVSLILVLALLLINATNQALIPYSGLTSLDLSATDILTNADEAGLLRPVVYLFSDSRYGTNFSTYQNLLNDYISTIFSESIGYALIAHKVTNGSIDPEYDLLIGSPTDIGALQKGGEGIVANYHLGSFTSSIFGRFYTQYLVQLYLWEKI